MIVVGLLPDVVSTVPPRDPFWSSYRGSSLEKLVDVPVDVDWRDTGTLPWVCRGAKDLREIRGRRMAGVTLVLALHRLVAGEKIPLIQHSEAGNIPGGRLLCSPFHALTLPPPVFTLTLVVSSSVQKATRPTMGFLLEAPVDGDCGARRLAGETMVPSWRTYIHRTAWARAAGPVAPGALLIENPSRVFSTFGAVTEPGEVGSRGSRIG